MLTCIAKFWKKRELVHERKINAENISELNHVAFVIAKETETNYSLEKIEEIKNEKNI